MAKRYLRNCSTSLVIRKMQIKITLKYHHISISITKTKNTDDSLCRKEYRVRGILLHSAWRINLYSQFGNQYDISQKTRNQSTSRPINTNLGIYSNDAQSYHKNICSAMFIVALLVKARIWKLPRCPSTKEWIKKI